MGYWHHTPGRNAATHIVVTVKMDNSIVEGDERKSNRQYSTLNEILLTAVPRNPDAHQIHFDPQRRKG